MHCQFYLRMGLVYVPTTAIVQRGVYQIVEPVVLVAVSDKDAVERALSDALVRGNPKIPAPAPSDRSPPVTDQPSPTHPGKILCEEFSALGLSRDAQFRGANPPVCSLFVLDTVVRPRHPHLVRTEAPMGYDLHITRKSDWPLRGNDISAEEWRAVVEGDPELRLDG